LDGGEIYRLLVLKLPFSSLRLVATLIQIVLTVLALAAAPLVLWRAIQIDRDIKELSGGSLSLGFNVLSVLGARATD